LTDVDSARHGRIFVGALAGGLIGYILAGWAIVFVMKRTHPGSDGSLVVALASIPLALISMVIGGIIGARRAPKLPP
jgi:hypothetical protein